MNLKTKIAMVGALSAVLLSGCSGDTPKKKKETVTTPDYLTVAEWNLCLTSKKDVQDGKGWVGYCMPVSQAHCCPQKAWDKLQTMNIPACSANTGFKVVTPGYLSVQDWKTCLKTENRGSWVAYCMPNKDTRPTQCQQSTYDKIAALKDVPPKCVKPVLAAPQVTTVKGVIGYQGCVIQTAKGKFCLISNDKAKKPATCTDDAFNGVTDTLLKLDACGAAALTNGSLTQQITDANAAVKTAKTAADSADKAYTKAKTASDAKQDDTALATATTNAKKTKDLADKVLETATTAQGDLPTLPEVAPVS